MCEGEQVEQVEEVEEVAEVEEEIPLLDFCTNDLKDLKDLKDRAREEWRGMCVKVREACENHGCFLVRYDGIPWSLREEMLMALKSLFDLPEETKQKHVSSKPYRSYFGNHPLLPSTESFGIDDATHLHTAHSFTHLMWPHGNPTFCETITSMSSKMEELNLLVLKMIKESYGVGKLYESYVENMGCNFRLMKYGVPPTKNGSVMGLVPHTDKNILTTLCQNEVQGLEVMSKEGKWIELKVPKGCLLIIVGDMLKAWSNGRLRAAKHRVMMKGEEDRYSCGLFSVPMEEKVLEVPQELVDEEHPLCYRPFTYGEYMSYYTSNLREDALDVFAAL